MNSANYSLVLKMNLAKVKSCVIANTFSVANRMRLCCTNCIQVIRHLHTIPTISNILLGQNCIFWYTQECKAYGSISWESCSGVFYLEEGVNRLVGLVVLQTFTNSPFHRPKLVKRIHSSSTYSYITLDIDSYK